MPEARDRLSRPLDIATIYSTRQSVPSEIYTDPSELQTVFGSPLRRPTTEERAGTPDFDTMGRGIGGLFTPRGDFGLIRNTYATPARGRENTPILSSRRGGSWGSNSVLPYWYPRRPLRDITATVRAIERRRGGFGGPTEEQRGIDSPLPLSFRILDSFELSSVAHLEHTGTVTTPTSTIGLKRCRSPVGKVPKILFDVTNQISAEYEFLTPQKKLLSSIDRVEKIVKEELKKLKKTPTARKAEHEKRVRTLMSMR